MKLLKLLFPALLLIPSIAQAAFLPTSRAETRALQATFCAIAQNKVAPSVLVVIDMSKPKDSRRLRAFNLVTGQLIVEDYVAHGRGSGTGKDGVPKKFSNIPGSLATSLGLYRVSERYHNTQFNDYRRRLDGLTAGLNDKARERAVVLHPASYVRPGAVGRSEGCPAVRNETLSVLEAAGLNDALIWIDSESEAQTLEAKVECGFAFNPFNRFALACPIQPSSSAPWAVAMN